MTFISAICLNLIQVNFDSRRYILNPFFTIKTKKTTENTYFDASKVFKISVHDMTLTLFSLGGCDDHNPRQVFDCHFIRNKAKWLET